MELIKFFKDNCAPCTRVENFLQDRDVEYTSINVMKNPELASKFDIGFSVPVVILMDGEQEVNRAGGYNEAVMEEMLSLL